MGRETLVQLNTVLNQSMPANFQSIRKKLIIHFTYHRSHEKSVTFCVFPNNQEELRKIIDNCLLFIVKVKGWTDFSAFLTLPQNDITSSTSTARGTRRPKS